MTATVIQIADSVVAELNAAELPQKVQAARLYVPDFDLEDMKELRVSVVPRDVEYLPLDRVSNKYHATIDVAIQKKFSQGDAKEIDPLVALCEAIADYFRLKRLQSFVAARCVKVENSVLYQLVTRRYHLDSNLYLLASDLCKNSLTVALAFGSSILTIRRCGA